MEPKYNAQHFEMVFHVANDCLEKCENVPKLFTLVEEPRMLNLQ